MIAQTADLQDLWFRMDRHSKRVPASREEVESIERARREALESTVGVREDFLPVRFLEQGYRRGRAVARVQIRKATPEGAAVIGTGTGFLVAPGILLTNHHVLPTVEVASASLAQFNYQTDLLGQEVTPDEWALSPDKLFLTSPFEELDFTLVAVTPRGTADAGSVYGTIPISADASKVRVGEPVSIIQHPVGRRKEVVLHDSTVSGFYIGGYVQYTADTLVGSSGSPVFNSQWDLVALHHRGVVKRDTLGRPLDESGNPLEEGKVVVDANEGIRISAIAAHLLSDAVPEATRARLLPFIY